MKRFWLPLVKLPAWLFTKTPVCLQYWFGDLLGLLWFDVLRIRRDIIFQNMEKAFPEWPTSKRSQVGRMSCRHMGRGIVEYVRIPFLSAANKNEFELRGLEHLEAARAKGKGACLLTLHLGNGDMGIAGLTLHGYPLHVISKEFKLKWLNDLWFGVRRRMGTVFIAPRNSSYAILKALRKEALVAFVLDQFMGPPIGVKTTFFGHETGTALGLAVIVSRTRSPVVPTYTFREADGKTVVCFEPEIPFEEKGDKDATLQHMTQLYTDKIEEIVRQKPEQWMWVHRRWKRFVVK